LLQWSFQKAYEVYTGSFSSLEKLDCLLCRCTGVTQDEVERYFKGNAQASLLQVTDQLKVGGLCGSCMGEVRAIKGQFSQQKFGREYAGGKTTAEFLLEIEEFFIRWLEKNRITGRFQFLSLVDFTLEMSWSGDKFNRKDLKHDFLKQTGIYLDFLLSP
jgi:bacterioferritin-associated ferredoxin